jgi:hypothetical protein
MMVYALVALSLLTALPAAALLGYWLGCHERKRRAKIEISHELPNALLALSGLLIGFTFAMAQGRYDARKEVILAEAQHIKTAYERTQLLDDARGGELRALLRQYVDARIVFANTGLDVARTEAAQRQSEALEQEIWSRVVAAARSDSHSVMISLLVQSTSQMIEASDARLAALANPLPTTVFVVLALVSGVALAAVGFISGLKQEKSWLAMVVMPLLLAVVILLVFDISYPRVGIVHVHDPILVRLKQSF